MDISESGLRDQAWEILMETLGHDKDPGDILADAAHKIVYNLVLPAVEEHLRWLGKTREDVDEAIGRVLQDALTKKS